LIIIFTDLSRLRAAAPFWPGHRGPRAPSGGQAPGPAKPQARQELGAAKPQGRPRAWRGRRAGFPPRPWPPPRPKNRPGILARDCFPRQNARANRIKGLRGRPLKRPGQRRATRPPTPGPEARPTLESAGGSWPGRFGWT
jgi:hypothetical protein